MTALEATPFAPDLTGLAPAQRDVLIAAGLACLAELDTGVWPPGLEAEVQRGGLLTAVRDWRPVTVGLPEVILLMAAHNWLAAHGHPMPPQAVFVRVGLRLRPELLAAVLEAVTP